MRNKLLVLGLTTSVILGSFTACGKDSSVVSDCPFSSLSWDATVEDMTDLEGQDYETYDSIYQGITYTYPKEYLGQKGMIKYMYDDKEQLCNISWSYTGSAEDEVMGIYSSVCDQAKDKYGEGNTDDGIGNYCQMWVETNETIMANAVITDDTKVMQIAYMRASVSKQDNQ